MEENNATSIGLWQRPAMVILLTLLAFLFMMGLGTMLAEQFTRVLGVDVGSIMQRDTITSLELGERQALRWFNIIAHLTAFAGTALLIAALARSGRSISNFLELDKSPSANMLGLAALVTLLGLPAIQLVNWLNSLVELPAYLQLMENSQNGLVEAVLQMESIPELMMGLLVAAIVPAVGEELLFRGVLQQQFQRLVNHPHWGIWLTAALFSAIHMQFAGFFPRMLLGAFLGYLVYWSGSLWLPILVHFLFNGIQVLGAYLSPDLFSNAEELSLGWQEALLGGASVVIVIFLLPRLKKTSEERPPAA